MKNTVVGAAILAVLMGLGACGQRGPLVLPKPADASSPAEAATSGTNRR